MENDIKKRAKKEQNRIKRILTSSEIDEKTMKLLEPVIENTAWMRVKLDDARELVGEEGITVEYNNGGGQTGVRENPNMKAYEALWKSYVVGLQKITDALIRAKPSGAVPDAGETVNVLKLIRGRKEA